MGETGERSLPEVPQIIETTGLSQDYLNELSGWKINALSLFNAKLISASDALSRLATTATRKGAGRIMLPYEERFHAGRYRQPVRNELNANNIDQINALATECNQIYQQIIAEPITPEEKIAKLKTELTPRGDKIESIVRGTQ